MLFHTPQFLVFLVVVLAAFYGSPRAWRRVILLAASYWFYMSWNAKFVVLIWVLTAIDYTAARWIARTKGGRRRALLVVSLAANLGFLGFFKYYNFLAANLAVALGMPAGAFAMAIILPMGISFHTFQSMSYVIDVYRGQQAPVTNVVDYALYIAFFPQLVAGPIVRAHDFFGDLWNWRAPSAEEQMRGVLLAVFGLVKKLAIADQFARVADGYFGNPGASPGYLAAWSGAIAFSMQIYFDFSGYTDMAIGLAQLFGFHFPENFRRPYLARSVTEFWRRWHISLSSWLRDYLYISLGGNRRGRARTYANLMTTMLLGGLWHGASWNFVIWGGLHGALLAVERAAGVTERREWRWSDPLRVVTTFALVTVGWVFFRAATLGASLDVLARMFGGPAGKIVWARWEVWFAVMIAGLAIAEERGDWFARMVRAPAWVYAAVMAVFLFCLEMIGFTGKAVPFVYFQF